MTRIILSDSMNAPATRAVFAALEAKGGKGCVRFVGGCVRNVLMDRPVSDLDLSTQLTPDEVEAALAAAGIRSVPTGKDYGTITAVEEGAPYEITSLREDVETDGRRAVVKYTTDWAKDAERRDFYLNALYADIEGRVYDPTGQGIADAEAGRVRFIGDAETRIREDYLRILRFFRFSAGYARTFDQGSLAACVRLKAGIDGLSAERIWGETLKTLDLRQPLPAYEAMQREGILPHVVYGWKGNGESLPELAAMVGLTHDPMRRLMALLDAGGGLADGDVQAVQARMRFSNAVFDRLVAAGSAVEQLHDIEAKGLLRLMYRLGRRAVEDAIFMVAAHAGHRPDVLLGLAEEMEIPVFPVKGADLIARGMTPGPELGQCLKQMETDWVNHDFSQSVIDAALDLIERKPS